MWRCVAVAAVALAAHESACAAAETPVQKVIKLLHRLREQVQEEGTAEAASYDKFACFCKEQADDKAYAIKKSQSLIDEHQAAIDALGTEIGQLDQEVIDHKGDITDEETEAETTNGVRQAALEKYVVERKNLTEGIDAIARAIETLRESRDSVEAVKAAAALVQTQSAMLVGVEKSSRFLSQQSPKNYEYRSSEVLQTLMELSKTFKEKLVELDEEEARDRQQHEMTEGARANKIAALQAAIDKKSTLSAAKSEEKAEREKVVGEETSARDADQSFLDELTTSCEGKAKAWDARSKARAAELTAMTQAIETLEGMGDLYNANKKLVGLAATGRQAAIKEHAPAFVQLSSVERSAERGLKSAVGLLQRSADALGSGSLAMLAATLSQEPATDHFVKVRSLIKDLIARLEQEALDEADAKSLCDQQMSEAVKKRDERQGEIEGHKAKIQGLEADIAKDKADMADLKAEIADLEKALKEMTELRAEEKARNLKTIADATAGAEAIKQALVVLRDYYGSSGALLEVAYVPPNSDREGKTVSDLAPESDSFSGEYKGKAAESKGVIGLLEVIQSDFERTVDTTDAYETEAETKFQEESKSVQDSISIKDESYLQIQGHLQKAESDLTFEEDDLRSAEKLHEDALEALEKLTASCVDSSESYAERRKRRQQEIEALQQALQILEDWKSL